MRDDRSDPVIPLLLGGDWLHDRPGGLNRYLADLLGALAAEEVPARAVVLGPGHGAPPGTVLASSARTPAPARMWAYARAAGRLSGEVDVVDAHFAMYAFLPVVCGGLRRLPLVVHFQGPWAEEDLGGGRLVPVRRRLKRLVEVGVYRRAETVVTLSAAFKRILVERYSVAPWTVRVVPPGVDLQRFRPGDRRSARRRLGLPEDARIVVAVRRLVPRMGLEVLVEAWAGLQERAPGALLVLVGAGPQRAGLEEAVAAAGAGDTVRFLGRVPDDDLPACYQAADVSVVPTVALEGFGLVVLESLACGTPVVATGVGGLPEALAGLDRSLVVPAGDAAALADRLAGVLGGSRPAPTGEACRRHAERFSWPAVARRHVELYRRPRRPPAPPVRVVFLDHCAALSGAELAMARLLPALEGVDAHVVLAEEGPLVDRLLEAGQSVEVLPLAGPARSVGRERVRPGSLPLASLAGAGAYTARLARRLRRLRPDLVHTNSLKALVYGGAAARLAGIPVVWHVRDRIADDYLPAPAVRAIRFLAPRVPAAVIANSAATLATLGPPLPSWRVVPSPVDLDAAPVPDRADRNGVLRVGVVGRIAPWKGQHVFLEAFARAFPGGGAEAVVVGAPLFGEDGYERELRDQADRLGVADRVDFRGFRDDVGAELARLDVLVHASTIPEPFGQVVVEGMAAGLPVVAAAAGGPAEVVDDGVTGLLSPPGDPGALADRLRALAGDAGLRRRLGGAARLRAAAFGPGPVAEEVVGVYREVLTGRGAAVVGPGPVC